MGKFKQFLKKTTAVLMIAVLLIGIAPIGSLADVDWSEFALTASAEEELAATGQCGENVYWNYNSETGELVISGTGPMYDYHELDVSPFYQKDIKTVIIDEGVTSIGKSAFCKCYSLATIEISDSVTRIGKYAFEYCSSLTSIEIPNSLTSIDYGVFSECSNLTSIELSDSVTSIGDCAFLSCSSLTSIELSDSITSIGEYAFYSCDSLTSVEIPDSVTSIGKYAFYNCKSLTSIEIPDSVTSIGGGTFSNCSSLTSIIVDSNNQFYSNDEFGVLFNKDKTIIIQYPTGNNRDKYIIPNSVTNIGISAFNGCESLTSIEIPDSVTSIGDSTFSYCRNLTSIEIPDSVTSIGAYAFKNCSSLTSIEIPDSVTSIGGAAFSGCSSLTSIEIPDSVTSIGVCAFFYCTSLTSIEISDSVTVIDEQAFFGCNNLTDVYYCGTEQEWNEIIIKSDNTRLTKATIHFAEESHTHSYTSKITTPATCTKAGTKTYTCSCGDSYTEEIKATGKHTGGTATCKAKAICSICKQAYGSFANHKETTLAGKSATYTSTGLTEGKKCSVCGKIMVPQTTIAKLDITKAKVDGLKAKKVKVAKASEITLSWTSLGEGVKYEIYQKNGKKWKKLKTTSSTSYTVKKLKADKEYQFRVRAVVDGVNGSYSKTLKVETIPETTTLKLKAGKKQLTASWSTISGISGYEVQYSTSKKMKSAKTVNVKKSSKKTTIKKLSKGKKCYVRVRAYKTVDGKKIYSGWSKVKNVKVK